MDDNVLSRVNPISFKKCKEKECAYIAIIVHKVSLSKCILPYKVTAYILYFLKYRRGSHNFPRIIKTVLENKHQSVL